MDVTNHSGGDFRHFVEDFSDPSIDSLSKKPPAERIADALERIANAQESQALILAAQMGSEEDPDAPLTVMTQEGPMILRDGRLQPVTGV